MGAGTSLGDRPLGPDRAYGVACVASPVDTVPAGPADPEALAAARKARVTEMAAAVDWLFTERDGASPGAFGLVAFPAAALCGRLRSADPADYRRLAVDLPGPETEALGARARAHGCYIAAGAYERDPEAPERVFETSFVVGPDGALVLRARRIYDAPGRPSGLTVLADRPTDQGGGPQALFPVAATPLGTLACISAGDIEFPEVARSLALRGAEIVIHLSSDPPEAARLWGDLRRVRAWDNHLYVVAAAHGEVRRSDGTRIREAATSEVRDFEGQRISTPSGQEVVTAGLDLHQLRAHRAVASRNILATSRFFMYAPTFAAQKEPPAGGEGAALGPVEPATARAKARAARVAQMVASGQLVDPDGTNDAGPIRYLERYQVACLQSDVHALRNSEITPQRVEEHTRAALERNCELIDWLCNEPRHGPRLVCFSEFHLTGVPETRLLSDYQTLAVEVPGWVTEHYGKAAKDYGIYITGGVFERDPDWPGRIFNTAFLIGPTGEVLLRYRKNNDCQTGIPPTTNVGDVYDAYRAAYGGDDRAFFPTVDTELGRIGLMTCYDIRFAEVPRMLALNGAEIVVHPTAESGAGAGADSWQRAKQVRAFDNACYFISTNNGETVDSMRPRLRQRPYSTQVVDFRGEVLTLSPTAGEAMVTAEVDLAALRRFRAQGESSLVASRFAAYAPLYQEATGWPRNAFLEQPIVDINDGPRVARESLERLYAAGVLVPPAPLGAR